MPIFPPNKGFKMPGVGSKNIDSPGNFRDEQHVDKVGYCDATEDSMLPELSSPFKARYTPSGYLKDIDVLTIPIPKSGCPKGYKVVDDECVKLPEVKPEVKPVDKKPKVKSISTRSKIVEATPDVLATKYETARQKLLADPDKLKVWEKKYGKADPENFKTQTDNWNTKYNTTTAREGSPGSENYYKTVDKGDETEIAKKEYEEINKWGKILKKTNGSSP